LQVSVSTISYTFLNGTFVSLLAETEPPINACLDTSRQRFTFTPTVASLFGNVTGYNSSSSLPGLNYPISQRPDGNLTVILNNGYKTVVPNSELFTIKRGSDDLGRYAIVNDSLVDSGINYNANADPASVRAILGGMFLTQIYLVVDYEMGIFKMAPAVQGPLDENRANLVPICSQRGDSVNGTDTSKPDPTAKTNVGAIAGGVVGGVGALVGIVLGVWWLLKRKRKVREEKNRRELENTHRQSSMLSVSELPSPVSC